MYSMWKIVRADSCAEGRAKTQQYNLYSSHGKID